MERTPLDRGNPKEARSPKPGNARSPTLRFFGFRISDFLRVSDFGFRFFLLLPAVLLLAGCDSQQQTPAQRTESAKALFEKATKEFHLPSADAKGAAQRQLQDQAAAAYEQLLKKYPDQDYWAAQALRSLANIRAAQTNLDAALKLYAAVGTRYPRQDWEVLMAWKSAADALWDAGRHEQAMRFYQDIVARFDKPEAPAVVRAVVRGSKDRLSVKGH